MATLREIRKRLRSVENIKQITKAMEMVAAARMRKAQAKAEQSQPYARKMDEMLRNLASGAKATHPFFLQRPVKKIGVVIIAADRGLCGSYNTNLFSAAAKFLKSYSHSHVELVVIGKKAVDHFQHKPWPIRHQIPFWGGKITFHEIKTLTHQLTHDFATGAFDEVWIVYMHYISLVKQQVKIEKLLNIDAKQSDQKMNTDYIFEPDREMIYAEIIPRYTLAKIQTALNEAYVSELIARVLSMRAAAKNADEMINSLTLVRNKVRQAGITKELTEVISGAEGLK